MNISIRLGHTDSVNSVDRQNFLDVELKNTSKLTHFTDIKETIDQFEQFKTERENCNKYRLILTINPYCTNVLFNPLTEIVYAEGSDKCEAIVLDNAKASKIIYNEVYGENEPERIQMINDTEYSKYGTAETQKVKNIDNEENYVYHPGIDIFDNHILRNLSFKIVNKLPNKGSNNSEFNTLGDFMRYQNGDTVTYNKRIKLSDEGKQDNRLGLKKHLYDYDNILSYETGDAITANLTEENGWWGFINASTIQSRDPKENPKTNKMFDELGIGYVMNDRKACEFVDMYPDRTLFSFTPKYNKYRNRLENNWDVILTYPYMMIPSIEYNNSDKINGINYDVVSKNGCNGLIILTCAKTISPSGETIILFRTLTKHGLKRGDLIRIYYSGDKETTWTNIYNEKLFRVRNIGNLDNEEKDYYFYINDMDFIRLQNTDKYDDMDETSEEFKVTEGDYRFARVIGSTVSSYYIRLFRKLPNFKYAKMNFPEDGSMTIEEYIEENAKDKEHGNMILFDKEQYKPAFETTIYTDDVTQIVFTDTIDLENLVDHRGRPLTEIYATVIKSNKGNKIWYEDKTYNSDKIEFSHCFSNISCGLEFSHKDGDSCMAKRQELGDIRLIDNNSPYQISEKNNISYENDDYFLGDIVEFNSNECNEKIIQPFSYRFNTYQRENPKNENITFHEIVSDDWDIDDFEIETKYVNNMQRPEGYYYQPHYRVPVREFGAIVQAQHYDVNVKSVTPVQADGIYLKITCLRSSNVSVGDTIYLFDDENNNRYEFVVTYLENRISFYISPKTSGKDSENVWVKFMAESGMNWLDVANLTTPDENGDTKLCFRLKNEDIPNYAVKVGNNKYLWRNVLKPGDMGIQNLPEYAYSNDAFYITNEINFFLRRQDPQGWEKLRYDDFPNDMPGNIQSESNYFYKEESEVIC